MVVKLKLSGFDLTREAIHIEKKGLVLIPYVFEKLYRANAQSELFLYFSFKRFFGRFSLLNFAARKFPTTGKITVISLSRHHSIPVYDKSRCNSNGLHDCLHSPLFPL